MKPVPIGLLKCELSIDNAAETAGDCVWRGWSGAKQELMLRLSSAENGVPGRHPLRASRSWSTGRRLSPLGAGLDPAGEAAQGEAVDSAV